MANNPGHSEIIETVVDVTMLEVVAEPDKKSSDSAISSIVEEDVPEIPPLRRKMNDVKGFSQRNVDEINSYCAMNWKSRNVVHDQGSSGFYKVPQNLRQRQGWKRLFDPTYINFSKIRDMLENNEPNEETRSLLSHYYYHFLGIRKLYPDVKLENYLLMIYEHREQIARCYGVAEADLDFPQLLGLLLSSCFIFYLFDLSCHTGKLAIEKDRECFHLWVNDLWVDLLVLENQIPFFILQNFFYEFVREKSRYPMSDYTFFYFCEFVPLKRIGIDVDGVHLLDIVHRSLLPDEQSDHRDEQSEHRSLFCCGLPTYLWEYCMARSRKYPVMRVIPTVTRLQQAGVQFGSVEKKGFVVEFKNGVFKLPRLRIRKNTEKFFMNLIAWEQCHQPAVKYVINFAILMDNLINTSKDVQILIQNNVLELSQVTEEEVAAMFNRLREDLIFAQKEKKNQENDFLTELSIELNKFSESKFSIWWADLLHVYFSSPWTILSLIGALLLLLLTLVQTFFSAFSYFCPPK